MRLIGILLCVSVMMTACTTTKHIIKRTSEKVKVYVKAEVIKSYELDKRDSQFEVETFDFDANYLIGFSFNEEPKTAKKKYPPVAISPNERPLYFPKIKVNIDLCKHGKQTSYREAPLEENAYGKNYSSFNPTEYKLFMSLQKLKAKNLVTDNMNEQEDICVYIDSKVTGHSRVFKNKSNKVRYLASEINKALLELQSRD